jgi:CBS domain-containing membrane protein
MERLRLFVQRYLLADAAPLSPHERWRSALAAFLGMLLIEAILAVVSDDHTPRPLLAPLGASSVILFALPHSPLGQPWSTAGGLLLSAFIGWACGVWITPAWLAIAVALGVAVWLMARLRCIHPPGGAMAVVFCVAAGSSPAMATAGFNVLAALAAALAVNALIPGRRWPQCAPAVPAKRHRPIPQTSIRHEDLQYALTKIDSFLDISEEDLVHVYGLALEHAHARHEQRTCADIMTTEVVSVEFGTELNEAWHLLRLHHLKALPVTDRARRVIGMICAEDFLAHVAPDTGQAIAENVRKLLRPTPSSYSSKPEVVGQIMSEEIVVARTTDFISRIAAILSARYHPPAIPVVDENGKLAGIIGQGDLLAALYHKRAAGYAAVANA